MYCIMVFAVILLSALCDYAHRFIYNRDSYSTNCELTAAKNSPSNLIRPILAENKNTIKEALQWLSHHSRKIVVIHLGQRPDRIKVRCLHHYPAIILPLLFF